MVSGNSRESDNSTQQQNPQPGICVSGSQGHCSGSERSKIAVDQLSPGMIVGADVCSPEGRLLLARGECLEKEHLRIFKAWGVIDVLVGDAETGEPEVEEEKDALKFRGIAEKLADEVFIGDWEGEDSGPVLRNVFLSSVVAKMKESDPDSVRKHICKRVVSSVPEGQGKRMVQVTTKDILAGEIKLPALSSTVNTLLESIEKGSSARAIAEILARDIGLSAKILTIVNSSFYGFPNHIESLSRAVAIIGNQQLQTIALGVSVVDALNTNYDKSLDLYDFWRHSVFCAILSKCLGELALTGIEERFFLIGLLHDVGRLVMIQTRPEMVAAAIDMAWCQKIPLYHAERELWGWDHAMLAGELCENWNFPPAITEGIRNHHCVGSDHFESGIIRMADTITHLCAVGNSALLQVAPVDQNIWKRFALTENRINGFVQEALIQEKLLLNILL